MVTLSHQCTAVAMGHQALTAVEVAGDVWHLEVKGCPQSDILYGVRVFGEGGWDTGHRWDPKRVLLDPYSPLIAGRRQFGVREEREQYKKGVRTC